MRKTEDLPNSVPASSDLPYGGIQDEATGITGTPVIEATYSDFIQSLWQFFRVTGEVPNGLSENTSNGFQLFDAMERFLSPLGQIKIWPSTAIPDGWLVCDGSSILRTDFNDLFALIGVTFGSVDGTHFSLPDLRGRFPIGKAAVDPIGSAAGEATHTLTASEIPAHTHYNGVPSSISTNSVYGAFTTDMPGVATQAIANSSNARTYQGKTSSIGAGVAHNNLPPYLTLNFIIKVKYGKDL